MCAAGQGHVRQASAMWGAKEQGFCRREGRKTARRRGDGEGAFELKRASLSPLRVRGSKAPCFRGKVGWRRSLGRVALAAPATRTALRSPNGAAGGAGGARVRPRGPSLFCGGRHHTAAEGPAYLQAPLVAVCIGIAQREWFTQNPVRNWNACASASSNPRGKRVESTCGR